MKIILTCLFIIFLGWLTGCTSYTCDTTFRDYKYMDRVKVNASFYKGQRGFIMAQAWVYNPSPMCNSPGFQIKIEGTTNDVIVVSQYLLEVY